ncbi:M48 family metalloprotease [Granulosicoccus sp. 3-233]|uniref:M48 family metalloprotease n=1 Tax=Granulosicoccus sp. 3-233 TaxID=3417969 RepID=UPI003D340BDB
MNFLDQQSARRRQSLILLACFVLALLLMGGLIHVVVVGLSMLLGEDSSLLQPSRPALGLIALVWLTMLAGGFFRFLDVRGGGAVLARRFGAVRASDRSRFHHEQRLLNVVAEIAIASSTPQPDVFVLRTESSINAMVFGAEEGRHVLVMTQGALDAFDRAELQAVIAHEFGHIANGDLPLNMRLLIALGGLMAIDEVGRLLIGDASVSRDEPISFHPGVIVGYILRGLGCVGVLAGQLLRSAFSRQREYLADASAVQFTRNPLAMASALDIIRQHDDEPLLHGLHAQELAHLCFQSGRKPPWYKRLFSSHPDIQLRIDAIEPHFDVKRRKSKTLAEGQNSGAPDGSQAVVGSFGAVAHIVGSSIGSTVGKGSSDRSSTGRKVIARDVGHGALSDRILLLLPDESSCLAALFALFAHTDPVRRQIYFDALAKAFNEKFRMRVKAVAELIPDELRNDQLGLVEHATSVLGRSIMRKNRQRILLKLEKVLNDTGECTLMNYATLQLIRRRLDVDFPVLENIAGQHAPLADARRVKSFDAMGSEFALLLSLMVETSGAPPSVLDAEFERVLKCYTQTRYPRRTAREGGIIKELEAAFQTLYVQPKPIRQAFVQHCLEIVQHDGYVARAERALLDLFAASLGCEDQEAA